MKILVIYYSRSGKTKKVAETISDILKCDKEEIFDTKNRKGTPGFLSAGTDANLRRLTAIKEIKKIHLHTTWLLSELLFGLLRYLPPSGPIFL
jgi:flavodoxin